jgi:short-subunit dehydrogenase
MSTALVTGATAGIGLSFAHLLAERGHDVVLVARDRARLENVSDELAAKYSVATEILVADLSDHADTGKVAERLADRARPVDLLVNNAGYSLKGSFLHHDVSEEVANFDVLCRAVLVLSHAAGNAMRERGHGAIVNLSSVASFITSGSYSANKSYVTVFTEGLAAELRGSGVTATVL